MKNWRGCQISSYLYYRIANIPVNWIPWPNAVLMLSESPVRWPNIWPALLKRLHFFFDLNSLYMNVKKTSAVLEEHLDNVFLRFFDSDINRYAAQTERTW